MTMMSQAVVRRGLWLGWNSGRLRIVWVLATIFTAFAGVIVYLALWYLMPKAHTNADSTAITAMEKAEIMTEVTAGKVCPSDGERIYDTEIRANGKFVGGFSVAPARAEDCCDEWTHGFTVV